MPQSPEISDETRERFIKFVAERATKRALPHEQPENGESDAFLGKFLVDSTSQLLPITSIKYTFTDLENIREAYENDHAQIEINIDPATVPLYPEEHPAALSVLVGDGNKALYAVADRDQPELVGDDTINSLLSTIEAMEASGAITALEVL